MTRRHRFSLLPRAWPSLAVATPLIIATQVLAALGSIACARNASAQRPPRSDAVHTDTLWAQSLGVRKSLTVYLPPSYRTSTNRRYPVLVYLHGLTGNERNWVDSGWLDRTLDSLAGAGRGEAIVVMPDGDDGWYTTWNLLSASPPCGSDTTRRESAATYCVPWTHYDDYIARDIVSHVDARYRTLANGRNRGIAGLSMGGYGAMTLAFAYPEVFAAAASHSGVLSPRLLGPKPFLPPAKYARDSVELKRSADWLWPWLTAPFGRDTIGWTARDPGRLAARAQRRFQNGGAPLPALYIDCGAQDGFVDQNRDFRATLNRLGVSNQYTEWPGKHDWSYWRAHAVESLDFLLKRTAP